MHEICSTTITQHDCFRLDDLKRRIATLRNDLDHSRGHRVSKLFHSRSLPLLSVAVYAMTSDFIPFVNSFPFLSSLLKKLENCSGIKSSKEPFSLKCLIKVCPVA